MHALLSAIYNRHNRFNSHLSDLLGLQMVPERNDRKSRGWHSIIFWMTVTSNGSPYATEPLSRLSVTLVYCSQTVGWIKMPLSTEIGLGAGDIVLDGDPDASRKGHRALPTPSFWPMSIVAKRSPISAAAELLYMLDVTWFQQCQSTEGHTVIQF